MRRTVTVSVSSEMFSQIERVCKRERRPRSELVRDALRAYFVSRIPTVKATAREQAAIRRGRAEIKAGKFVTLEKVLNDLERRPRKRRRKAV